jgi:hypothetical protein
MDEVRRQLAPYLLADEHLLWCGRPDPAKHFTGSDVFLVPFSLMWGGFAIFWMGAAVLGGAPVPFALFGLPFVVMGLYFIFGRFLIKARRKRETAYGLTERRVLVAVGQGALTEAPLGRQPIDQRLSRDRKHMSVLFGPSATGWLSGPSYANTGLEFFQQGSHPVGFFDVADVAGLEAALRRVRR